MIALTPATVFAVSGGGRGITAQCVIALARAFRCKFILLGRSAVTDDPAWAAGLSDEAALKKGALIAAQAAGEKATPALISKRVNDVIAAREIRATLDAVRAAGGQAVYASADVTDAASLRAAISGAGLGQVTAILHGAGNLADKLIENKTAADFEKVYAAKVEGLANLLEVVPNDRLTHLILFSSVAGFYGNIGQADYAIANEILNKAALSFKARYPACHVVSINWGPWDGGMVTPQLRAYFDSLDIKVIPVEVGVGMLVDELAHRGGSSAPAQIVIGSAIRPQPSAPAPELHTYQLKRRLHLDQSPFLGDHVVNGQAVLPMVSAMSWMASACEGIHRGFRYFSFENYRVLKGIVFDHTLASEYILEVKEVAKSADEIRIDALVRSLSAEGKPRFHYSAQIVLRARVPEAPFIDTTPLANAHSDIDGTPVYHDGTLFHGYSFQGVQRLLHIDDHGLIMRCNLPVVDADYQGQFPIQAFNYFMVDIGLQSIGIWSRRTYNMGSLPLRAGRGFQYRDGVQGQLFYVTMTVRAHNSTNVTADIVLHDADGRVYMTIDELEVTMSQRLNELFLNNRLQPTR